MPDSALSQLNRLKSKPCQLFCGRCPGHIERRTFLSVLIGFAGILWGAMALIPLFEYLLPKRSPTQGQVSHVIDGLASALPVNSGKVIQFGSIPAIIVHAPDGSFHAFSAICSHMGCTVTYRPDLKAIWCPCHGGTYDPTTAKVIAGPPPRPLDALKVEVVGGKINISSPS